MNISDALANVKVICCPKDSHQVIETVIDEFRKRLPGVNTVRYSSQSNRLPGESFLIAVMPLRDLNRLGVEMAGDASDRFIHLQVCENGSGRLPLQFKSLKKNL